ncbi:sensor histidine kinase [Cellulosimicrobium arenosum]|uniref:histidine kinase n=1 Tax=Cellulosimicrobium arenosum TaxID=2708133 RepID=A0A927J0H9_9MICO|nr:histidine kinase [Cellulosimicrobium arenosum]MBD8079601.1 sensor histidine kinase [Cellulosimicrobium arenosum]
MGPLDRRRPRVFLAVLLTAISVLGTLGAAHGQPQARTPDAAAFALLLVAPVVVVLLPTRSVRRTAVAVVVSVAACGAYLAAGYPWGPALAGPVVVLAAVVLSGPVARSRAVAWGGAVLLAGTVVAATTARPDAPPPASLLGGAAWTVVVLLAAVAVRDRAARAAEAREARRATQEERERNAVAAERLRIAREVHDVLAHSLSAISVQAGVGLHLLDRDPEQARRALAAIRSTSVEALDEVRAVLGVVRAEPGDGLREPPEAASPLAPTWDLTALARLVQQASAGGLDVRLDVDPAARALPDRLVGVVYRVVQESLTNIRRHAPDASRADVRVRVEAGPPGSRGPRTVTVVVSDDGATPAATPFPPPGYGLRGMRERVGSVGGRLDHGPSAGHAGRPGGRGFRVRARFPWPAPTPGTPTVPPEETP